MHKKLHTIWLFLIALAVVGSNMFCAKLSISSIKARDPIIGMSLDESGHVLGVQDPIPSTAEAIYMEFYLDAPPSMKAPLEIKWYINGQLFYTQSTIQEKGYVISLIERDASILMEFPVGHYNTEVWFLNTQILNVPFDVIQSD